MVTQDHQEKVLPIDRILDKFKTYCAFVICEEKGPGAKAGPEKLGSKNELSGTARVLFAKSYLRSTGLGCPIVV